MKTRLLILSALFFTAKYTFSQNWVRTWQEEKNLYTMVDSFNNFWRGKDSSVRGQGYKQFKRWQNYVEPRVYPSGDITLLGSTFENYQAYSNSNSSNKTNQTTSTTWAAMGPFGNPTGLATNGLPRKAGRLNFVTFDPSNSNIIWVGAANGGLWKTTNGGVSWNTTNNNISVTGCTDLAIDPTNSNIMYLATGDGYDQIRGVSSIGVWKTIDGGVTWNPTPLVFNLSAKTYLRRIIINPVNPQIVLACASTGIYRTTNAGATWPNVPVQAGNIYDIEFNPVSPDTVYSSGLSFRRSTNAGLTWTQISTGIPTSGSNRMEIATSIADPKIVYVVSSSAATSGLQGIYKSTDKGATFSTVMTATNIIGQDCFTTSGSGGQGWYDLGIDVSPLNPNELTLGALGIWRSTNGGVSWFGMGCAYPFSSPDPFIHADHHELEYTSAGVLFSVNDGGICKYNGTTWTDLTDPMNIAQIYKIGLSGLSPNKWITGHQDNGSCIYSSGIYNASLASDGMDCFIDRTNDQNMFACLPNGALYNSTNGGASWNNYVIGAPGAGGWVTPWKQDPQNASLIWMGKTVMYSATIGTGLWSPTSGVMTGTTSGEFIKEFAIAPSNNQYMYVIHGTSGIQVTTNGGATWVQSNNGFNPALLQPTSITVDASNPQIAWLTFSGYSNNNKVYKTVNAGGLWTNISNNQLPNLPANCSTFELGNTNGRVYVGMDVGVYYIDNTTSPNWTLYSNGLPNTPVSDLEMSAAAPTKLRAATFGRGVYQVDIVPSAAPPATAFNYAGNTCSVTSTLYMNDNSTNSPTSWSWSVTPSSGVIINTPTSQNPTISIANPGTYSIALKPTNGFGSGSTITQTVSISPTISAVASSPTICPSQSVSLSASGAASYTWQPGGIVGSVANYTPAASQVYTVNGTGFNSCVINNTVSVIVTICTGILQNGNAEVKFSVYPNPFNDKLNVYIGTDKETELLIEVYDMAGKNILTQTSTFSKEKNIQQISIATLCPGVYFLKLSSQEGKPQIMKVIKE